MYPYSSETAAESAPADLADPAEDEPTMTDLHGVLPAQRPPVDATVLDEPTSEVPVIRPVDQEPDAPDEPAGLAVGHAVDDAVDYAVEDAVDHADLDEPVAEPAEMAAVGGTDPDLSDLIDPAPRTSEMSKMTWTPAPRPEPATPLAEAEPPPLPERSFPEPSFPERSFPERSFPEPSFPERSLPEPSFPERSLPERSFIPEPSPPAPVPTITATSVTETAPETETEPETEPAAWAVPEPEPEPALAVAPPELAEPGPAGTGRPGDVAESPIALWSAEAADRLRAEWRDLQGQFIDDPDAAVAGAKELVTDAVHELAETLLATQDALDPYRGNGRVDTETMRVAMRRYREFLERVLAL